MVISPKNPSTTWYFTDWANDPALKICSLAAQGLWMRLLCIAALSPEHGVVQIGSLTCGLPGGLAHIAPAVGRPPHEIAPLIDELLSSGAASLDRKQRLFCRRMVRAAALYKKRSAAGKNGADVTNGKHWGKESLPRQKVGKPLGKPPPLHDFKTSKFSHGEISTGAARPPAPDGAASRTPGLTSHETWQQRLAAYDPHNIRATWKATWGPRPDAPGIQPMIPPDLLRAWREQREQAA
jgi:hypothetical protein